jgi:2-haloacid dehalogenase
VADQVIVFDVNETLLDLGALDPIFADIFGAAAVRGEWFTQVLQSALVSVATGVHRDFGRIARGSLEMVASRRGVHLTDADAKAVLDGVRRLPPHPEVIGALQRLRAAGLRLATLTNSPPETAEAQLAHAGLTDLFDARFSVEGAGRLKPAPAVYRYAAAELGVAPMDLRLVAAHSWDVTGAMRAGWAAAFVARTGQVLDPTGATPDLVGADLDEVADQLLARLGA